MPFLEALPWVAGIALGVGYGNIGGVQSNAFFNAYFDQPSDVLLEVFSASMQAGCIFSGAAAGPIADRFGRRACNCLGAAILSFGCVLLVVPFVCSVSFTLLFAARLLIGIGNGISCVCVPMYIGECALPNRRGALETSLQLAIETGILLAFVLNWVLLPEVAVGWKWSLVAQLPPSLLLVVLLLALPESPRWLLFRRSNVLSMTCPRDDARQALLRLRSSQDIQLVEEELIRMASAIENRGPDAGLKEVFSSGRCVTAMIVLMLQVGTGIDMFTVYAPDIFGSVLGSTTEAQRLMCTISVAVVFVIMTSLAVLIVDRVGRRPLLLTGAIGMTGSMLIASASGLLPVSKSAHDAITIGAVLSFVAFFSFSWGPLAWVIPCELVHSRLRAHVLSIGIVLNWVADYAVIGTFLSLRDLFGQSGVFAIYAGINCVATLFCWWCVPETRGCHLDEHEPETSCAKDNTTEHYRDLSGSRS